MAQGITVQGKTQSDRNQPILVDEGGRVYVLLEGVSTESTQQDILEALQALSGSPTTGYGVSNIEETGTYKYFGFENKDGAWYIMRKTLATNVFQYASGTSDYATAWSNRASQTYASYSATF